MAGGLIYLAIVYSELQISVDALMVHTTKFSFINHLHMYALNNDASCTFNIVLPQHK